MFRRRFKLSYNNVGDGVYAVNKNLRLIPVSESDNTCIAVALVYDRHRIMIEKFGELNQSYKETTEGYINDWSFYYGEYLTDQPDIVNYDKAYNINTHGYLKPEKGSYGGSPGLPSDIGLWTSGALSDWDGKANSEVLKNVLSGDQSQNSHPTIGCMLNAFIDSSDAKGLDDWYIPSCAQLALIFMNLYSVDNALSAIGGLQIGNDKVYWSSSERNTEEAWNLSTKYLHVSYDNKNMGTMVRFIRDI